MAKRFFLSKLVQNERGIWEPRALRQLADAWLANQGDATRNYAIQAFIAENMVAGPKSFALCIADCINLTDAVGDADNLALPDLTLDTPLGSNWTTQVRNKLTGWGFAIGGINSTTTLGDALQILCDQIKNGWNRNSFDVDKPVI